jgi:hypothetical protein
VPTPALSPTEAEREKRRAVWSNGFSAEPQNRRSGRKNQQKLTKITKVFPLGFLRLLLFKPRLSMVSVFATLRRDKKNLYACVSLRLCVKKISG